MLDNNPTKPLYPHRDSSEYCTLNQIWICAEKYLQTTISSMFYFLINTDASRQRC